MLLCTASSSRVSPCMYVVILVSLGSPVLFVVQSSGEPLQDVALRHGCLIADIKRQRLFTNDCDEHILELNVSILVCVCRDTRWAS